jgi:hypothetical protein
LSRLSAYLERHREHIDYQRYKELGLPTGSGMVESTCKWLIQQRFKGVGMRWSEEGFTHLLHLRLCWVNGRFDALFPGVPPQLIAAPLPHVDSAFRGEGVECPLGLSPPCRWGAFSRASRGTGLSVRHPEAPAFEAGERSLKYDHWMGCSLLLASRTSSLPSIRRASHLIPYPRLA